MAWRGSGDGCPQAVRRGGSGSGGGASVEERICVVTPAAVVTLVGGGACAPVPGAWCCCWLYDPCCGVGLAVQLVNQEGADEEDDAADDEVAVEALLLLPLLTFPSPLLAFEDDTLPSDFASRTAEAAATVDESLAFPENPSTTPGLDDDDDDDDDDDTEVLLLVSDVCNQSPPLSASSPL